MTERMRPVRPDMIAVIDLWLHDHPGGTVEDFERASAPFNAERGSRHRRVHNQFLDWLNSTSVQRALFQRDEGR
jgi:hypothetical protein